MKPDAIRSFRSDLPSYQHEGPPWDVNELPPHLQGFGHRVADQDGGDGEWLTPEEDYEAQRLEAIRLGIPWLD